MKKRTVIALLTDFGLADGYVGVMKGAIACINPRLRVIDISHEIPPQNVAAARFCLMSAHSYFPPSTVHLAVVDPGVGGKRRGVAIAFAGGYLVGPDNGLFSGVLSLCPALAAVELNRPEYWLSPKPSSTFHGRDIFAPVAAHLASGVDLQLLGSTIQLDSLAELPLKECRQDGGSIFGSVQYIDHFGNLITNIPAAAVQGKSWQVVMGGLAIPHSSTYSDGNSGELVALIGSHGWVEIAVNCGNARERLQLDWGNKTEVKILS
jgi:S-adenosylmethionine hydrolase